MAYFIKLSMTGNFLKVSKMNSFDLRSQRFLKRQQAFFLEKFHGLFDSFILLFSDKSLRHINFMQIARIRFFTRRKHLLKRFIFLFAVRKLIGFYGRMDTLNQCRFEADTGTCNPDRLFLPPDFIAPRCESGPTA